MALPGSWADPSDCLRRRHSMRAHRSCQGDPHGTGTLALRLRHTFYVLAVPILFLGVTVTMSMPTGDGDKVTIRGLQRARAS